MLMNTDGSGLQQLTHFCYMGYVKSHPGIAATGYWGRGDSTIYAQRLIFPNRRLINCSFKTGNI